MADAKLFQRSKLQELRAELQADKKDKNFARRKTVLKRVVASMTMGQDLSPLYPDVLACLSIQVVDIKKMVYLFLINYARVKPEMVRHALPGLLADADDKNALVRALAMRTMSYIPVPEVLRALVDPLHHALKDRDPYVRKTAAICVAKLYMHDRRLVDKHGFVASLRDLLMDPNPTVIANAVASLTEISERSDNIHLRLNADVARRLVRAMTEASEWGQTYILEALMYYVPDTHDDATLLAEQVSIRLQHSNSAVVLATVKVMLYLMNYMGSEQVVEDMCRRLSPPLVTLLSSGYEVQYVALRNIHLIIQRRPSVLRNDVKVFFCKYNDPIYVKLAKLEIIYRLAHARNVEQVLAELKEYASEVDVDFVRKAVRTIGRLAIKVDQAADLCISVLLELVKTKVSYVVQEAIVVIKNIFRRYPNRYEGIIGTLCENLDALDTPDAKSAMIWIVGQYADRISNSDELLEDFLETFLDEPTEVQLALLTATVKLFIKRPTAGAELVPRVLKWATESVDNPDLRDRGFIYWRLLSTDPAAAQQIVLGAKPDISTEGDALDRSVLDRLLLHTGSLASIYHKEAHAFVRGARAKYLGDSPALDQDARDAYAEQLRRLPQQQQPQRAPDAQPAPLVVAASPSSAGMAGAPALPQRPAAGGRSASGDAQDDFAAMGPARGGGGGGAGGAAAQGLLDDVDEGDDGVDDDDEEEEGAALNPGALSAESAAGPGAVAAAGGGRARSGTVAYGTERVDDEREGDEGGGALDPYASLARLSLDLGGGGGGAGGGDGYGYDGPQPQTVSGRTNDDLLL
ncbi:uncharacterized protein RHOBADRAFT_48520 [Rhodotorula graminis WP1]|uniref:Clathrin/coatomer adaptor adaptin-like N-terminal domain-containing protein n=1 Tax=Rhodotorula graminis (strain WP1) TaxID=578459 RepID=A0A194S2S4_RHOGW|nr:uncharacterized protein RHOBADRAFT_48520 [Rhodotorula graminis WP1]KPV74829.1 hypothetical protein RHOBADRAFT_48520 [Rhodotorula graminis WP1]